MFYICRSVVFLPIFVYIGRSVYSGIFTDYFVLSVIGAYTEKNSYQEKISGNGDDRAVYTSYSRYVVGYYDIWRQAVRGAAGILYADRGTA